MEKLKSLKFLETFSVQKKKQGKKIILCHGNFDLLHFGHINHFKSAKKLGDYLVVSITSDKFIKKGLDRPFFKQRQRLEFLSHLSMVDFVYLDGDHSYEGVKLDLQCWYPKLKEYGVMCGDDYGHISGRGVIKAVNEFAFDKKVIITYGDDNQFWFVKTIK